MNKSSIYTQIMLNALPVVGYWFWEWSMFAIIYIYWAEAMLISLFVFMKIVMAQGVEPATGLAPSPSRRVFSGFKVLLIRVALLMFYWIFIFLFVGLGQGKYSHDETIGNMQILVFRHPGFNLALLAFFLPPVPTCIH